MREGMAYHVRLFGEKPHSVIHDISGVHDIVVDFVPFRSEFVVPVTLPLHLEKNFRPFQSISSNSDQNARFGWYEHICLVLFFGLFY